MHPVFLKYTLAQQSATALVACSSRAYDSFAFEEKRVGEKETNRNRSDSNLTFKRPFNSRVLMVDSLPFLRIKFGAFFGSTHNDFPS